MTRYNEAREDLKTAVIAAYREILPRRDELTANQQGLLDWVGDRAALSFGTTTDLMLKKLTDWLAELRNELQTA